MADAPPARGPRCTDKQSAERGGQLSRAGEQHREAGNSDSVGTDEGEPHARGSAPWIRRCGWWPEAIRLPRPAATSELSCPRCASRPRRSIVESAAELDRSQTSQASHRARRARPGARRHGPAPLVSERIAHQNEHERLRRGRGGEAPMRAPWKGARIVGDRVATSRGPATAARLRTRRRAGWATLQRHREAIGVCSAGSRGHAERRCSRPVHRGGNPRAPLINSSAQTCNCSRATSAAGPLIRRSLLITHIEQHRCQDPRLVRISPPFADHERADTGRGAPVDTRPNVGPERGVRRSSRRRAAVLSPYQLQPFRHYRGGQPIHGNTMQRAGRLTEAPAGQAERIGAHRFRRPRAPQSHTQCRSFETHFGPLTTSKARHDGQRGRSLTGPNHPVVTDCCR